MFRRPFVKSMLVLASLVATTRTGKKRRRAPRDSHKGKKKRDLRIDRIVKLPATITEGLSKICRRLGLSAEFNPSKVALPHLSYGQTKHID